MSFGSSPIARIPLAAASFGTSELLYNKPGTLGFGERQKTAAFTKELTGGATRVFDADAPGRSEESYRTQAAKNEEERQNLANKQAEEERLRVENLPENQRKRAEKAVASLGLSGGKRPSASTYLAGVSP